MIAKVNGAEIHQSDLSLAEEDLGRDIPVSDEAGKRDYLVNYLADLMLVAKAAEAKKIPDTAEFKQRITADRPDGKLTEPVWQQAPASEGFTKKSPLDGKEPGERTVVREIESIRAG